MDETDKIDEMNEIAGEQPASDAPDFPNDTTPGQTAPVASPPATDDRTAWRAWWRAQGQSWRIEPEIAPARQTLLAERRAIAPDVRASSYPFAAMTLTRADVEWL